MTDEGERNVRLEIGRPTPGELSPWTCVVALVDGERRLQVTIPAEDGIQAIKLAMRAADMKIRVMAEEEGGEAYWLDSSLPPVFDEFHQLGRVSGSLENAIEALDLAQRNLRHDVDGDLRVRILRVLESVGVYDVHGVHLRNKRPRYYGPPWEDVKER